MAFLSHQMYFILSISGFEMSHLNPFHTYNLEKNAHLFLPYNIILFRDIAVRGKNNIQKQVFIKVYQKKNSFAETERLNIDFTSLIMKQSCYSSQTQLFNFICSFSFP